MAETTGATAGQIHHKFKVFAGAIGPDGGLGELGGEVARFVAQSNVAAKSIGVEYIESANRLLLTLGYRDDEAGYPVTVTTTALGKVDILDTGNFTSLEAAMEKASLASTNILCHAEYVTTDGTFVMVFLTQTS